MSIGLPVKNGARYLRDTVASLLSQSFRDLELIISDNASTDETPILCEEFASSDSRVRYFRQDRDIGGPANWNFVVRQARGIYFKWSSANDLCDPTYVERCEAVLREEPGAVLCYARTAFLDGEGRIGEEYDGDFELLQATPLGRFKRFLASGSLNNAQHGLIRTSALRRTGLERNYESGDLPLMAELALLGTWRLIPDCLFYRRVAPGTHMSDLSPEERRRLVYHRASRSYLPFLRTYLGFIGSALRVPLSVSQRGRALVFLLRYLYWHLDRVSAEVAALVRSPRPG